MGEVYLDFRFKINTGHVNPCDNELEIAIDMADTLCQELKENNIINVHDIEVRGCGKINPLYLSIDEFILQDTKEED